MAKLATVYSPLSKGIHWMTALLVLMIIPGGIAMIRMPEGELQNQIFDLHRSLGVTVFALAFARVAARQMIGVPAPLDTLTPFERRASVGVHHALIALLFLMPLIGWLMTSAYRVDVSVFGLFTLPHLMPQSEPIFDALAAVHKTLGFLMAGLILTHIGAAIMHTFIKRDGVLQRMLPWRR
jgi:cytochrome b561